MKALVLKNNDSNKITQTKDAALQNKMGNMHGNDQKFLKNGNFFYASNSDWLKYWFGIY